MCIRDRLWPFFNIGRDKVIWYLERKGYGIVCGEVACKRTRATCMAFELRSLRGNKHKVSRLVYGKPASRIALVEVTK